MTIFLYRTSIPFASYEKHHWTTNNAEVVNKNTNFRKVGLKILNYFFKNLASFSCKRCEALSPDMQIIILLWLILYQTCKKSNIRLKVWNPKFCKYHNSMQRMLSASTCNVNHYFTINNEEWVSKMSIFSEKSV